jgi:hypothetical protein
MKKDHRGPKNPRWNGGRRVRPDGYVDVYSPGHPCAYKNRALEHRLVYESHIGRYLHPDEIVHHINENKSDNRIGNLELLDRVKHAKHHFTGVKYPNRFKPRISKSILRKKYIEKEMTLREIALEHGISYGSIRFHCIKFGIQIRRPDPWLNRRKSRKSFSRAK